MEITFSLRFPVPLGSSARAVCGVAARLWVLSKPLCDSLLRFFARFSAPPLSAFLRLLRAAKIVIILDNAKRFGVFLRAFLLLLILICGFIEIFKSRNRDVVKYVFVDFFVSFNPCFSASCGAVVRF